MQLLLNSLKRTSNFSKNLFILVAVSVVFVYGFCYYHAYKNAIALRKQREHNPNYNSSSSTNNVVTPDPPITTNPGLSITPLEKYKIENNYHCEVVSLGCLKISVRPRAISISWDFINSNWCFTFCSTKKFGYAGLTRGNTCVCSEYVNGIASQLDVAKCDLNCPKHSEESCGGEKSVEAYRIITPCKIGHIGSPSFEDIHHIEYISNYDTLCLRYDTRKKVLNTSTCILYCGVNQHSLAFVNPKHYDCYCGRFDIEVDWTKCIKNWDKSSIQVYRTLAEDKKCEPISFLSTNNSVKRAGLISYPGSGNTWSRHLIEQASGIYTGTLHYDGVLFKAGFLGAKVDFTSRRSFVIKDHLFESFGSSMKYHDTAILLVRNPYNAIRADFNRENSSSHTGSAKDKALLSEGFKKNVAARYRWDNMFKWVFSTGIPFHLLVYEDLAKDPIKEIRAVMKFLEKENGFKQNDLERRLLCLNQNLRGNQKRKTASKLTNNQVYSDALKLKINNEILMGQVYLSFRTTPYNITSYLLT